MARILIVEDEDAVRRLVSRGLQLDGHDVTETQDGQAALERLVEADGSYDLVLSDIRMPVLNGLELAHAIAAGWPGLKVLLMTGYAEQMEAAAELDGIVDGVLEKPFAIGNLRETVKAVLVAFGRDGAMGLEPRRACA